MKMTVEKARQIDILKWAREGFFTQPEVWQICRWMEGEKEVSSIGCIFEDDGNNQFIGLQYRLTDWKGNKKEYDYKIQLDSTVCNFGGERLWFICPLVVNGKTCGRRARILYLPAGAEYFGCRECYQLTYESRQKHGNLFYEQIGKPMDKLRRWEEKYKKSNRLKDLQVFFQLNQKVINGLKSLNQSRDRKVNKLLKKS